MSQVLLDEKKEFTMMLEFRENHLRSLAGNFFSAVLSRQFGIRIDLP